MALPEGWLSAEEIEEEEKKKARDRFKALEESVQRAREEQAARLEASMPEETPTDELPEPATFRTTTPIGSVQDMSQLEARSTDPSAAKTLIAAEGSRHLGGKGNPEFYGKFVVPLLEKAEWEGDLDGFYEEVQRQFVAAEARRFAGQPPDPKQSPLIYAEQERFFHPGTFYAPKRPVEAGAKLRPEAVQVLNALAMAQWQTQYMSEEELLENYVRDWSSHQKRLETTREQAEGAQIQDTLMGIDTSTGRAEAVRRTTDPRLNKDMAEFQSLNQARRNLMTLDMLAEDIVRIQRVARDQPTEETVRRILGKEQADMFFQDAFNTIQKNVPRDVLAVPMTYSARGEEGIDLNSIMRNLTAAYTLEYLADRGLPIDANKVPAADWQEATEFATQKAEDFKTKALARDQALFVWKRPHEALEDIKRESPEFDPETGERIDWGPGLDFIRRTGRAQKVNFQVPWNQDPASRGTLPQSITQGKGFEGADRPSRFLEEGYDWVSPEFGRFMDNGFRTFSFLEIAGAALKVAIDDMERELKGYSAEERKELGWELKPQRVTDLYRRMFSPEVWGSNRHLETLATEQDSIGYLMRYAGNLLHLRSGYRSFDSPGAALLGVYAPDDASYGTEDAPFEPGTPAWLHGALMEVPGWGSSTVSLVFDPDLWTASLLAVGYVPGRVARGARAMRVLGGSIRDIALSGRRGMDVLKRSQAKTVNQLADELRTAGTGTGVMEESISTAKTAADLELTHFADDLAEVHEADAALGALQKDMGSAARKLVDEGADELEAAATVQPLLQEAEKQAAKVDRQIQGTQAKIELLDGTRARQAAEAAEAAARPAAEVAEEAAGDLAALQSRLDEMAAEAHEHVAAYGTGTARKSFKKGDSLEGLEGAADVSLKGPDSVKWMQELQSVQAQIRKATPDVTPPKPPKKPKEIVPEADEVPGVRRALELAPTTAAKILKEAAEDDKALTPLIAAFQDLAKVMRRGVPEEIAAAQKKIVELAKEMPDFVEKALRQRQMALAENLVRLQGVQKELAAAIRNFNAIVAKPSAETLQKFGEEAGEWLPRSGGALKKQAARILERIAATRRAAEGLEELGPPGERYFDVFKANLQKIFEAQAAVATNAGTRQLFDDIIETWYEGKNLLSVLAKVAQEGDLPAVARYVGIGEEEAARLGNSLGAEVANRIALTNNARQMWLSHAPNPTDLLSFRGANIWQGIASGRLNPSKFRKILGTKDPLIYSAYVFRAVDNLMADKLFQLFRMAPKFMPLLGQKFNDLAEGMYRKSRHIRSDIARITEKYAERIPFMKEGTSTLDTTWGRLMYRYLTVPDEAIDLTIGTRKVQLVGNITRDVFGPKGHLDMFVDLVLSAARSAQKNKFAPGSGQDILSLNSFILSMIRLPRRGLKLFSGKEATSAAQVELANALEAVATNFFKEILRRNAELAKTNNVGLVGLGNGRKLIEEMVGALEEAVVLANKQSKLDTNQQIIFRNPLVKTKGGETQRSFIRMVEAIAGGGVEAEIHQAVMLQTMHLSPSAPDLLRFLFEGGDALREFIQRRTFAVGDTVILQSERVHLEGLEKFDFEAASSVVTATRKTKPGAKVKAKKPAAPVLDRHVSGGWQITDINPKNGKITILNTTTLKRQVVSKADIAYRSPAFSIIDVFDATAAWGVRYVPSRYRAQIGENFAIAGSEVQKLIASAGGPNGTAFSASLAMRSRVLTGLDNAFDGLIKTSQATAREGTWNEVVPRVLRAISGQWKSMVLMGFTAIGFRPDRPLLIFWDDTANVWVNSSNRGIIGQTVRQAGIATYGLLNWLPVIGPPIAKKYAETARAIAAKTGRPQLGPAIDAIVNNHVSDVLMGAKGQMEVAEGMTSFRNLMVDAIEDGITDHLMTGNISRKLLNQMADAEGWDKVVGAGGAVIGYTVGGRNISARVLDDWLRDVTVKQRMLLYLNLRSAAGEALPRLKAKEIVLEALYDWQLAATSSLERSIIREIFPWYVWQKNVINQSMQVYLQPGQLGGREFLKTWLRGGTKAQRLKMLDHVTGEVYNAVMPGEMPWQEARDLAYELTNYDFLAYYPPIASLTIDPEVAALAPPDDQGILHPEAMITMPPIGIIETSRRLQRIAALIALKSVELMPGMEDKFVVTETVSGELLDWLEAASIGPMQRMIQDWRETGQFKIQNPEYYLDERQYLALQNPLWGQPSKIKFKEVDYGRGKEKRAYVEIENVADLFMVNFLLYYGGDAERRIRLLLGVGNPELLPPRIKAVADTVRVEQGETEAVLIALLNAFGAVKVFTQNGARTKKAEVRNLERLFDTEIELRTEAAERKDELRLREEEANERP